MLDVFGKTIQMVAGDTARFTITCTDAGGIPYTPAEGDLIRFAVKDNYSSAVLLEKDIDTDTRTFHGSKPRMF